MVCDSLVQKEIPLELSPIYHSLYALLRLTLRHNFTLVSLDLSEFQVAKYLLKLTIPQTFARSTVNSSDSL